VSQPPAGDRGPPGDVAAPDDLCSHRGAGGDADRGPPRATGRTAEPRPLLVGFAAPTDPMWRSTLRAVDRELVSDSRVHRYDPNPSPDGLPGSEESPLPEEFRRNGRRIVDRWDG